MTSTPIHPIAGCGALEGSNQEPCHRRWLIIDENGEWLDSSRCPGISDISLSVRFGYLVIRAPGMLRMDIPIDVIEDDDSVVTEAHVGGQPVKVVDEGTLAAAWLGDLLGRPCRLVKVHPDAGAVAWPD